MAAFSETAATAKERVSLLSEANTELSAFVAPKRVASLPSRSTKDATVLTTTSRETNGASIEHAAPAHRVAAAFTSASRSAAPTPSAAAETKDVAVETSASSIELSGSEPVPSSSEPSASANAGTKASHAEKASAAVL